MLLITTRQRALRLPFSQASMMAWRVVPVWEARMPRLRCGDIGSPAGEEFPGLGDCGDYAVEHVGAPGYEFGLGETSQEFLGGVYGGGDDVVGTTQLDGGVAVACGGWDEAKFACDFVGLGVVGVEEVAGVECLDDVDVVGYGLEGFEAEGGRTNAVEGVGDHDKATLGPDFPDGLLGGKALGNGLFEEEADDISLRGFYFLADDDVYGSVSVEQECSFGGVVVGDGQAVDAGLDAAIDYGLEWGGGIVGVAGVNVEVCPKEAVHRSPARFRTSPP